MARQPETRTQVEALTERLRQSRRDMGDAAIAARQRIDVPARLRRSVRRHPGAWFGGSAATGLLAAFALRRHKARQPTPRRGAALAGVAGLIVSVLKPLAIRWLRSRFR